MRRATVYISGCLPRPSNFARLEGWGEEERGWGEMEEEVGERQVEAGGERGRTRHLPLPYLLLPPPPSPAFASLGPATVARGLPSYAPNGAERL
ncbi:hypothetical protein PPACK8108_LOCUS11510 [Phakopsora pachyrhizi]|uniref:Uncharacterized protein n=1 Tax=Phakopsora pachyrhizi TaxID=170000 RepID=A0AAV0B0A6_PHAPC|nr:hypothetical protein PPACK8108_LOCUS11510 [Phakopsora pachyrhizi]